MKKTKKYYRAMKNLNYKFSHGSVIYVQYLHEENYISPMKEIKEELNEQGDISCSWIERVNLSRCQFFAI